MITYGKKSNRSVAVQRASEWDAFIAKEKGSKTKPTETSEVVSVPSVKVAPVFQTKRSRVNRQIVPASVVSPTVESSPIAFETSIGEKEKQTDLVHSPSSRVFELCFEDSPGKSMKPRGRVERMKKGAPLVQSDIIKVTKKQYPKPLTPTKITSITSVHRPQSVITYGRLAPTELPSLIPSTNTDSRFGDLFSEIEEEEEHVVEKIDEGLETSDDDEKPKIQGFHQLRAAGHSKQFADESNYIFEGLFSLQLSIQRSSCFDLIKKLRQDGFSNSLRIHGHVKKLYQGLRSSPDSLVHISLIFILSSLSQDLRNLDGIIDDDFINWLHDSAEKFLKEDLLVKLPKKKYDKTIVLEFIHLVSIDGFTAPISTLYPVLDLLALSLLTKSINCEFNPSESLSTLLKNKIYIGSQLNSCLALVEYATNATKAQDLKVFCDTQLVQKTWDLFIFQFDQQIVSRKSLDSISRLLRILINLHGPKYDWEKSACDVAMLLQFLSYSHGKAALELQNDDCWFDVQVLFLGLLTNLVEKRQDNAIDVVKFISIDKVDGLELLANIFSTAFSAKEADEKDPIKGVFCAYVAIFIGHVVKHRKQDRLDIVAMLPSGTFDNLIYMVNEYILFHQAIHEEHDDLEDSRVVYAQQSLQELITALS